MKPSRTLSSHDWLLAETIRLAEERDGRHPDETAVAIARATEGGLPERLAARAAALPQSLAIRDDIVRLQRLLRWLAAVLVLAGLVAGGVAARTVVAEREVDILLAAAALLLLPTAMLLVWAGVMVVARRRDGSHAGTGSLLLLMLRWLGPRVLSSTYAADVMAAMGNLLATRAGRWRLSVLTHAFWLAYATGALALLLVIFSVVQYELTWGTTLLDDATVVLLVERLAWWPAVLGFMPPADPAWIAAGREGLGDAAARADWARFLLAMIAAWALLPRAVLMLLSIALAARSGRRLALDTSLPGYLRLAADVMPPRRTHPVGPPPPEPSRRRRRKRRPGSDTVLVVAIELERSVVDLPRLIPGMPLIDLGRADDRAGRGAAIEAIERMGEPAAALIAICSLLRTPDAGTERFLVRLAETADAPLWLVLDEAGRLERRGGQVAAREADWLALAERTGGHCLVLDLDAPDASAVARLHRGIGHGDQSP